MASYFMRTITATLVKVTEDGRIVVELFFEDDAGRVVSLCKEALAIGDSISATFNNNLGDGTPLSDLFGKLSTN